MISVLSVVLLFEVWNLALSNPCPPKYTNLCDTWNNDGDDDHSQDTNLDDTMDATTMDATKDYKFGPPRSDKRCGSDYDADCIEGECCSAHGWCGSTKAHCNCHQCYRFTNAVPKNDFKFGPPRSDKRCGSKFNADCIEGTCCSAHGWCGSTKAHCYCDECYRFAKKSQSKDPWKKHGDSRYFLVVQHETWYDARKFCLERDAHLVDIDSVEESNFVLGLADESVDRFWIGINDLNNEGEFVRSDGNAPSFLNWFRGEPNDHHYTEDCAEVIMGYSGGKPFNGRWNDLNCDTKHSGQAFVCEKPAEDNPV